MATFRILAFDLSMTGTGWALGVGERPPMHGTATFPRRRGETDGHRLLAYRRWVYMMLATSKPDLVVYEDVRRHLGTQAAHAYGFLRGALLMACAERGRPSPVGVGVGVWKLAVLGARKGNAPKDVVMAAMRARGHRPMNHNEADALAILEWARATHTPAPQPDGPWPKPF